jgi:hypothetical protein
MQTIIATDATKTASTSPVAACDRVVPPLAAGPRKAENQIRTFLAIAVASALRRRTDALGLFVPDGVRRCRSRTY